MSLSQNDVTLSRTALALFTAGIILPAIFGAIGGLFLSGSALDSSLLADAFLALCMQSLAFVFGIISWQQKLGKIATVGAGLLLLYVVCNWLLFLSFRPLSLTEIRSRADSAMNKRAP